MYSVIVGDDGDDSDANAGDDSDRLHLPYVRIPRDREVRGAADDGRMLARSRRLRRGKARRTGASGPRGGWRGGS